MTALTIELSPETYEWLRAEAERVGKPLATFVEEWLNEQKPALQPVSERDRAIAALRAAGLLVEDPLGPELRKRIAQVNLTLEEVSADLDRAGGRPLSEIILEQRGPKE